MVLLDANVRFAVLAIGSALSFVAVGVDLTTCRGAPTAAGSLEAELSSGSFLFNRAECLGAFWEVVMAGLMKIKDAAKLLALSESMIRKMLTTRQLTAVRIGRSVRVRAAELEALIAPGEQ